MKVLSQSELEGLQRELDALRARVTAEIGAEDAAHIRAVRTTARALQVAGRALIHVSLEPVSFGVGVAALALYEILENMEIGHNVLHGQYDFMHDPSLDSATYEWDIVATAKTWKRAHNVTHHTYTNVIGKDDDFGYTLFRFSDDVAWTPLHLAQPILSPLSGVFFDHSVALYDLRLTRFLLPRALRAADDGGGAPPREVARDLFDFGKKALRLYFRDYVFYPALAGPFAPKVAAGNALANVARNLWAYAVIYCGHLPEGTDTFPASALANESRGAFYARQIAGSSNFEAGPLLGVLSGHLSHQIEHHLFPEIPAWRYRAMSPEVRRICAKYGVPYRTGTFGAQLRGVARALVRNALPGRRAPREAAASAPATRAANGAISRAAAAA